MPVLADAEHDEVERRGQDRFVSARGRIVIRIFRTRTVNLLHWHRNSIEQRLLRHPIIAVGVIGRHAALVTEEDVDERPGHVRSCGECLVNCARCRTSSQGDAGTSALLGQRAQLIRDVFRGSRGKLGLIDNAWVHGVHRYSASAPGSRGRYGAVS